MMRATAMMLASFLAFGGCGNGDSRTESETTTDKAGESAAETAPAEPEPASEAPADPSRTDLGAFSVRTPKSWQSQPPSSRMRKAQWAIPGKDGAAAELVVYYFGAGGAGGVQANLSRWIGQFEQPDGTPSKERAKIATHEVNGRKVTTVDLAGTYVAKVRPAATERLNKPEWRMLAAIVETPTGPYYFKLVGPAVTVQDAAEGFAAMIGSIQ